MATTLARYRDAVICDRVLGFKTRRHPVAGYQVWGRTGWYPCPAVTQDPAWVALVEETIRYLGDGSRLSLDEARGCAQLGWHPVATARFGRHPSATARTLPAAVTLAAIRAHKAKRRTMRAPSWLMQRPKPATT
jgi:hypothetical protein